MENTGDDRLKRPLINRGTYFLYCGEGTKDMAETMFGTSLREGVCFTLDQLSRKQIVPRMTKIPKQKLWMWM